MSIKSSLNSKTPPLLSSQLKEVFASRYGEHQSLAPYNVTKTGGVADHLVVAQTSQEIVTAANLSVQAGTPFRILGGGTNLLVSEVGWPGLAIVNRSQGIGFLGNQVFVQSGVSNAALLHQAAARGLGGLEFLAGVPGTIGGAVATGAAVGPDSVVSFVREIILLIFNRKEPEIKQLSPRQLNLQPYQPVFRLDQPVSEDHLPTLGCRPAILAVKLQFSKLPQEEIVNRLASFHARYRRKKVPPGSLGYFLTKPLPTSSGNPKELRDLGNRNLRLGDDPNILQIRQAQPTEIRRTIKRMLDLRRQAGIELDERIDYLGYWPNEDG